MSCLQAARFLLGSSLSLLAFGIWRWSDQSPRHESSTRISPESDIVAALDQEAALTTGRIWEQGWEEEQ
jgi:hypothetical protein